MIGGKSERTSDAGESCSAIDPGQQRGAYTLPDHFPDSKAIRYFHDDTSVSSRSSSIECPRRTADASTTIGRRATTVRGTRIGEVCGQANGDRQDCFLGAHGNFSKPVGDFGTRVGLEKPEFTRTCSDERAHVLCVGGGVRGEPNSGCRQMEASRRPLQQGRWRDRTELLWRVPRRAKRLPQPPRPRPEQRRRSNVRAESATASPTVVGARPRVVRSKSVAPRARSRLRTACERDGCEIRRTSAAAVTLP